MAYECAFKCLEPSQCQLTIEKVQIVYTTKGMLHLAATLAQQDFAPRLAACKAHGRSMLFLFRHSNMFPISSGLHCCAALSFHFLKRQRIIIDLAASSIILLTPLRNTPEIWKRLLPFLVLLGSRVSYKRPPICFMRSTPPEAIKHVVPPSGIGVPCWQYFRSPCVGWELDSAAPDDNQRWIVFQPRNYWHYDLAGFRSDFPNEVRANELMAL